MPTIAGANSGRRSISKIRLCNSATERVVDPVGRCVLSSGNCDGGAGVAAGGAVGVGLGLGDVAGTTRRSRCVCCSAVASYNGAVSEETSRPATINRLKARKFLSIR